MIIELFGPPAAGKTTLAHAVAAALGRNGLEVELIVSSRPAERRLKRPDNPASYRCRTALAPLTRAAKLVSVAPSFFTGTDEVTASLMDLLPPRTALWSIRYRRFLYLLSRSWKSASESDRIVVFDQGFLTALCSMALLARHVDPSVIARGLALIPRPDLLVRVNAPREILKRRLDTRLGRQGAIERLFEMDLQTSLQQIDTTNAVARVLEEQGSHMIDVTSLDRRLLEKAVDRIVRAATSRNEEVAAFK